MDLQDLLIDILPRETFEVRLMNMLVDKNVNFKDLKNFIKNHNLDCDLVGLNAEQENKKLTEKPGLLMLGGPTKLGGRLASKQTVGTFEEVKKIIGRNNIGDCLYIELAVFEKYELLITEDKDLLTKRSELKEQFPTLTILSLSEFKHGFLVDGSFIKFS